MIAADQPKIFGSRVLVAVSNVTDGDMSYGHGSDDGIVTENRRKFLSRNMIAMQSTTLVKVSYDRSDYTQYAKVTREDKGRGIVAGLDMQIADGLATEEKSCALFLPLADCLGAVFYDPRRPGNLMLSHLGRHSLEQYGAEKSVQFMRDSFGSKPEDMLVWLGPSPNGTAYPLWERDNKSFTEAAIEDLERAGVLRDHIEISDIDTAENKNYFSHSEFLKGNRDFDGRYAIVAKLR